VNRLIEISKNFLAEQMDFLEEEDKKNKNSINTIYYVACYQRIQTFNVSFANHYTTLFIIMLRNDIGLYSFGP